MKGINAALRHDGRRPRTERTQTENRKQKEKDAKENFTASLNLLNLSVHAEDGEDCPGPRNGRERSSGGMSEKLSVGAGMGSVGGAELVWLESEIDRGGREVRV